MSMNLAHRRTGTFTTNITRQMLAGLMLFEAATLAAVSTLHLTGGISGGSKPYDPDQAGIAEAVIGVVLATGAIAGILAPARARAIGLITVGFAIVGFLVGLNFTIRGGTVPDVLYHAIMLPILLFTFVAHTRTEKQSR